MRIIILLLCLSFAAQSSAQWSFGTNVVTREAQLRAAAKAKARARARAKARAKIKRHVIQEHRDR